MPGGHEGIGGGGVLPVLGDHSVEVGASVPSDGPTMDANSKPDDAWSGPGNNGTADRVTMEVDAVCVEGRTTGSVESAPQAEPQQ